MSPSILPAASLLYGIPAIGFGKIARYARYKQRLMILKTTRVTGLLMVNILSENLAFTEGLGEEMFTV
jgi:hypothetical protein